MAAPLEVIVSSDSGSQLWNSTVFDLHSGSSLLSYRGGNSSARTLTVLSGQYLLSAQLGKNFINVWEIQRKDQLQQKIVCPGVVTCLTASSNGLFLAAAVAEAIYLWEVSTGKLLSVLSRHYQDVTCLKFTDDSSHFVSGGKDNLALVWSLSSVIQLDLSHTAEPRHVLSRHSLPITDLHCGLMGAQARVATASLDQTVKVWELSSGELLLSVLFDVEIMSVTFDPCEYFLFCGGSDGNIFQVSLCSQSLSRDKSFQSDNDGNQVFKGHRNLVTCLSVSMDGTLLLSGSHDETVQLWDVQSKQSIRCLAHKGLPTSNGLSGDDNPSFGWTDGLVVVPRLRHVFGLSSCSRRRCSQRTRLMLKGKASSSMTAALQTDSSQQSRFSCFTSVCMLGKYQKNHN